MNRTFRLAGVTAVLATLTSLPAQAATFQIDLSLGGADARVNSYDRNTFSMLRVTGTIDTSATGTVAASALDGWQFSFFRDAETTAVASISKTDPGANAGTGSFTVIGNELFSDGFLLGVWSNLSGFQRDKSIRFNTSKQLVVYAREDNTANNVNGVKSFDAGFSFFQDTGCDAVNLTNPGAIACGSAGQVRIGSLAAALTPVPLPAAGFLLLAGVAGLGLAARRKSAL